MTQFIQYSRNVGPNKSIPREYPLNCVKRKKTYKLIHKWKTNLISKHKKKNGLFSSFKGLDYSRKTIIIKREVKIYYDDIFLLDFIFISKKSFKID